MLSFQGVGATSGKGSGIAIIHKKNLPKHNEKFFGLAAIEVLEEIKIHAVAEIQSLIEVSHDEDEKAILLAHQLIINDPEVNKLIVEMIDEGVDLIKAIKQTKAYYHDIFLDMDNEVFRTKILDVEEVFERLISSIKIRNTQKAITKNFVLVCDELLPTTIYDYPLEHLRGIVLKRGSLYAHGVIIAKSKNIPVVIGLGNEISKIKNNNYLVVDGLSGKVVLISE